MVAIKTLACLLLTGVANAQLPLDSYQYPNSQASSGPGSGPGSSNASAQTACNNAFPNTIPVFREDGSPYGCAPAICGQPGVNIMC
ncbi:uncharacterized protein ATNIH1004_007991 [Aspergillus tanneri]|uniref:Uncharacterized protein n=1 Tax=Aspergillus tanneri TaxID=1220188 RepID=A0A5M9MHW0_9EURO|nr:uncharacterized protein ATNIH1004_007991 [Aspergillus tanneri]KAA8646558.1 hypothetical protein ATNIH1004_007991 [Aspergillus tanneri]